MNFSIPPARFYKSNDENDVDNNEEIKKKSKFILRDCYNDPKPRSLLRPAPYKKEFWKQNEALANAQENTHDDDILCCFVFQDESERRRFLVTYPEDMWEDCEQIPMGKRVFYEVIPEGSPCFLYYDLEFEVDTNEDKNGTRMTQTLINVTCEYINKYWQCNCNVKSVLNLDSSRQGKFSKHLIFSTNDFAFFNNYHVGNFVKTICLDLIRYLSNDGVKHDVLDKFDKKSLEELFIVTKKGRQLFIDLNVYTKNRHFRIYKATKWGKNSHLKRSPECRYVFPKKSKNKELDVFLQTLISYLPRKNKLKLLSFDQNKKIETISYTQYAEKNLKQSYYKEYANSPYPALDKYVADYVTPGKVRVIKYLEDKQLIVYEILGNRYCENIGRCHKSNNVFFVVDLINQIMIQKCHDQDCSGFVSRPKRLPIEVTFYFKDEADSWFSNLDENMSIC